MSISYGDLPSQRSQITYYATYRYFCSSEYSISLVSPIYKESCTFTQPFFFIQFTHIGFSPATSTYTTPKVFP